MSDITLKQRKVVEAVFKGQCKTLEVKTGMSIGEILETPALVDVHREPIPKAKGGTYKKDNYQIISPVEHMRVHGNLRERTPELEMLKNMVDERVQIMSMDNKINNQIQAYARHTDSSSPETLEFLTDLRKQVSARADKKERELKKAVRKLKSPLAKMALKVRGLGEITIAFMLVYIDLEKARHASSMWSYVGFHAPSHERYKKGEAGGGNKTLRTVLYNFAASQIKCRGPYRTEVYDRVKARLEASDKLIGGGGKNTRNTKGQLVECMWKDAKPSHRHGAAMRQLNKLFLADYWYIGRTLDGLPTDACYAEAQLGKNHKTISPEERGWDMDLLKELMKESRN